MQIARDWNVKHSGSGYVTRFQIPAKYYRRFKVHNVGSVGHSEFWIPSEELEAFNEQICGQIEVIHEFHGAKTDQSRVDQSGHTWVKVYDLAEDQEQIRDCQKATLETDNFGLVPEVALFGTDEWWRATEDGRIPLHRIDGTISRVYMTGHNDWPEFEVEADGKVTQWTREGRQDLYEEGRKIKVEYVTQRLKSKDWGNEQVDVLVRVFIRHKRSP